MGRDGGMKEVCERQERRATFNEKSRCLGKHGRRPLGAANPLRVRQAPSCSLCSCHSFTAAARLCSVLPIQSLVAA